MFCGMVLDERGGEGNVGHVFELNSDSYKNV